MFNAEFPSGYRGLVLPGGRSAPLRLALAARIQADDVAGYLVTLGPGGGGECFLGAWVDASGRVYEWLEVNARGSFAFSAERGDRRDSAWQEWATALAEVEPKVLPPILMPALILDHEKGEAYPLGASHEVHWEVCREDALLHEASLPEYSASPFAYLYQPARGGESAFVPLREDAPRNDRTREAEEALGLSRHQQLFNAEAAPLIVRPYAGIRLDDFDKILCEGGWRGIDPALKPFLPPGLARQLDDPAGARHAGGYFFFGDRGKRGDLAELLYLKLQIVTDLLAASRALAATVQRPFFHLSPETVRIQFGETAEHLPWLWNFRIRIGAQLLSTELPVPTTETRYFGAHVQGYSIYRPEAMGRHIQAEGTLRIREVSETAERGVVIKGTLAMDRPLDPDASDLMRILVPVAGTRTEIYSELSLADAMAQGEVRFSSLPRHLPRPIADALKSAEGVPLHHVPYQLMPAMRTPCDIYSIAVIATRLLLVNGSNTPATALDEVMSLGRQASESRDGALHDRVSRLLAEDARWLKSLGPQRLVDGEEHAAMAQRVIPLGLWARVLGFIGQCIPGLSPDSYHEDLGDVAAPRSLELAYDAPLRGAQTCLLAARNLMLGGNTGHLRVRSVLKGLRKNAAASAR